MNLEELRASRGYNREQLARALDTSAKLVWQWEKGRVTPSLTSARKLADILDVSLDEISEAVENTI